MGLLHRCQQRHTPMKVTTHVATHPLARRRTVTRDNVDSYLLTIMTVSTLLVGIGTTQYSIVTMEDTDTLGKFDKQRTLSAQTWCVHAATSGGARTTYLPWWLCGAAPG
jgi:hypothetical protein